MNQQFLGVEAFGYTTLTKVPWVGQPATAQNLAKYLQRGFSSHYQKPVSQRR